MLSVSYPENIVSDPENIVSDPKNVVSDGSIFLSNQNDSPKSSSNQNQANRGPSWGASVHS